MEIIKSKNEKYLEKKENKDVKVGTNILCPPGTDVGLWCSIL